MTAAKPEKIRWADERVALIMGGEEITVSRRRALSYLSRGMATLAADPEPTEAAPAQADPAGDSEAPSAEADEAKFERTLRSMNKDELVTLAADYSLDTDGTKEVLRDRIMAHTTSLSPASDFVAEDGATAGDEPLSGSDSNAD